VAPLPVKVALDPTQIAVGDATAVTVGALVTTNDTVCVFEQAPVVPVTV
jgi:hypothetical protein